MSSCSPLERGAQLHIYVAHDISMPGSESHCKGQALMAWQLEVVSWLVLCTQLYGQPPLRVALKGRMLGGDTCRNSPLSPACRPPIWCFAHFTGLPQPWALTLGGVNRINRMTGEVQRRPLYEEHSNDHPRVNPNFYSRRTRFVYFTATTEALAGTPAPPQVPP